MAFSTTPGSSPPANEGRSSIPSSPPLQDETERGSPRPRNKRLHEEMNGASTTRTDQANSEIMTPPATATAVTSRSFRELTQTAPKPASATKVAIMGPPQHIPVKKSAVPVPSSSRQSSLRHEQTVSESAGTNGSPHDRSMSAPGRSNQEMDRPEDSEADLDPISDFDWAELEQRYHDMIKDLDQQEEAIWEEFKGLLDYFGVWAAASKNHETARSCKRHKTQQYYVQHKEQELEKRRNHYVTVVKAFEQAMLLLDS